MLGIDTNVLVCFLVKGDGAQFEKARKLLGSNCWRIKIIDAFERGEVEIHATR